MTIEQIKQALEKVSSAEDALLKDLQLDERKGVQQLLKRWYKQLEKETLSKNRFFEMTHYENALRKEGYRYIAGMDEVGRGPLAGPVVAAAVILPKQFYLPGLDDSKKLTEEKRDYFYQYIYEHALHVAVGSVPAETIDEINIYEATKKAMLTAVAKLPVTPEYLLVDAMKLETTIPQQAIVKGDSRSVSIAAASIVAKVTRDRWMKKLGEQYPVYKFEKNMGYGTQEHLLALDQHGITPYHRKSFAPVAQKLALATEK